MLLLPGEIKGLVGLRAVGGMFFDGASAAAVALGDQVLPRR